jgi:hypothetical protein
MDEFLDICYSENARQQIDDLVDSDVRYIDEPEIYEQILAAVPERVGLEMGHMGKTYHVFHTKQRFGGPVTLWISYKIDREKHRIDIFDIRQHPNQREK